MGSYHEYCSGEFHPDDVVISGMSGRFPNCRNVGELGMNMYSGEKDLMAFDDQRFVKGACGLPFSSRGLMPDLDRLESSFFRLPPSVARASSPDTRKTLEVAYEAVLDAGYDPWTLRGQRIGVYHGALTCDSHTLRHMQATSNIYQYMLSMTPGRIAHSLDFTGPCVAMDTACSSSFTAFWMAATDIREGRVEAAVVTGGHIILDPKTHAGYITELILPPSGHGIPFDASSDGMIRSEAVAAIFLQKASVARRAYATTLSEVHTSSGYVPAGMSVPSYAMQTQMTRETLGRAGVSADALGYAEMHAAGTPVGDPIEMRALADVCGEQRAHPLPVASVKSHIGHTEAASGVSAVIAAIMALESGRVAPSYRYRSMWRPEEVRGRLRVVSGAPEPLEAPYVLINSFGVTGNNVQVLLRQNRNEPPPREERTKLPRLVFFPATTEEGVETVLDYVKARDDLSDEFFALLNHLAFTPTQQKPVRGYALLPGGDSNIQRCSPERRPVWFVVPGMGCEWVGMGLRMMAVPAFRESMERSADILQPMGVDLISTLSLDCPNQITPKFIALAAIQMALVDTLRSVGVEPDGIVAHSFGETMAAYADGSATLQQVLLSAVCRGHEADKMALEKTEGAMAAVGLSWAETERRCAEAGGQLWAACDNADDSVTVSGERQAVDDFLQQLRAEGIFAKKIFSYGFAFHCPIVEKTARAMIPSLREIFPEPKARSPRWVSSTFLESEWQQPECRLMGAEYLEHNMSNPVRFREALAKIPKNAVTVEIGPHHLLRALLKRSVGPEATHIALMRKNHPDNVAVFMDALGQMYTAGVEPQIERLYPPVKFPVPRGTPTLSNLVRWNYSESLPVTKWAPPTSASRFEFQLHAKDAYLLDHVVDGRPLFPAAGYVWLAWQALAAQCQKEADQMPVSVENLKIHSATLIGHNATAVFSVSILRSSGHFEVLDGSSLVASGEVRALPPLDPCEAEAKTRLDHEVGVQGKELYEELRMSGYEHGPAFQRILRISEDGRAGELSWGERWIPFLDSLLFFFGTVTEPSFRLPTSLLHFKIDPAHLTRRLHDTKAIHVSFNPRTRVCRTAGIEVAGLVLEPTVMRQRKARRVLEEYRFTPHCTTSCALGLHRLRPYADACDRIVRQIAHAVSLPADRFTFNQRPEDEECSERGALIETLEAILQKPEDPCATLFSSYAESLGRDSAAVANLIGEDAIRLVAQVVADNSFTQLSALEASRDFPVVLPTLETAFRDLLEVKVKKSVLVPMKGFTSDVVPGDIQVGDESVFTAEGQKQDLVVTSFSSGTESQLAHLLELVTGVMRPGGFLLFFHKEALSPPEKLISTLCKNKLPLVSSTALDKMLLEKHLIVLSKISDLSGFSLYLLRSPVPETPHIVLSVVDNGKFEFVEKLKSLLATDKDEKIWLVAEDVASNGIVGMVNCLRKEPGGEKVRCVFIPPTKKGPKSPAFSLKNPFYKELLEKDLMMNVFKDGTWGSFKHFQMNTSNRACPVDHSYVTCGKYGDLSTLQWHESSVRQRAGEEGLQLVHVYYSALNFKDVMHATGKLSVAQAIADKLGDLDESVLGFEFSGRDEQGARVAGICGSRGMATATLVSKEALLQVPDTWSLRQAATVPIVYATSYYALLVRGHLQRGESVLVHSGTGGVGLAAIRIALTMDCEVFATVGNESKRKYLKEKFPTLKDENIGCSRNTTFEQMIMEQTQGRGVDLVLNSLADEKFLASVRCVAKNGRFVEIGKYDISLNRPLGLKVFERNISFHGVTVDALMAPSCAVQMQELLDLVRKGISSGVVVPLDATVFARDRVEDAFRHMAKGVHVGKVLLQIREEESSRHALPTTLALPAIPCTYFYPQKTYVVVGGLGGFGVEVCKWLVRRGARRLVVSARSERRSPYHALCVRRWERAGCRVRVATLDAGRRDQAEVLLREAAALGPVGGIFNSALVLRDGLLRAQSASLFAEVGGPKASATRHLDALSRALCPHLDFFVCFSSIASGKGNAAQTNYGFANSAMERICEERVRDGLHGLAIQWGIIGGVGAVHRLFGESANICGLAAQSVRSCLDALDRFLRHPSPVVTSYVLPDAEGPKALDATNATDDLLAKIANTLGVQEVRGARKVGEMGVDSMIGIELKALLEEASGRPVSLQDMLALQLDDIRQLVRPDDRPASEDKPSSSDKVK